MASIKELFTFNKAERRGIFVLALIIVLLLIYRIFGPFSTEVFVDDNSQFQEDIARFLESEKKDVSQNPEKKAKKQKARTRHYYEQRKLNPRPFDPNVMSYDQWIEMGLSEKQARTIEKYKAKGGHFRVAEDFRKIYCISEKEFNELSPYIIINPELNDDFQEPEKKEIPLKLELNSVNEEQIQCVRGIGPAFASRIIKYRNLLGGYVELGQLMEVYGMDSIRFRQISPFFTVNPDSLHHIDLNTCSYKDLLHHPYITKQIAFAIIDYRKSSGRYTSVEELKNLKEIDEAIYQKIYRYFAAESK